LEAPAFRRGERHIYSKSEQEDMSVDEIVQLIAEAEQSLNDSSDEDV